MSMHQMEDFIEEAVRAAATSDLPVLRKRSLIHVLFELETYGDCGFTNLRTIEEMLECQYSFSFRVQEMFDYAQRKAFYDAGENGEDGDPYFGDEPGICYVDSGTKPWEAMVKAGAIKGEGALPLETLSFAETLKQVVPLIGEMDPYTHEGLAITAVLSEVTEEFSDEEFVEVLGVTREEFEEMLEE